MGSGMSISASGLQAASRQFATMASNIVQLTAEGGSASPNAPSDQGSAGTGTSLQTSRLAYDPQAPYATMQGMVTPDSDVATEIVHLRQAQNSFKANLQAYKASSQMFQTLLDATA